MARAVPTTPRSAPTAHRAASALAGIASAVHERTAQITAVTDGLGPDGLGGLAHRLQDQVETIEHPS